MLACEEGTGLQASKCGWTREGSGAVERHTLPLVTAHPRGLDAVQAQRAPLGA